MLILAWPWLLLLLLLPLLVRRSLRAVPAMQGDPLVIPTLPYVSERPVAAQRWHPWLLLLAWACLCLALARPQWLGEPIALEQAHRNLMLAVDLSDSMRTQDMVLKGAPVDRLSVVKQQLTQFVNRREGDRMGLILFADHAYVMMPLSADHATLAQFIDELDFGLAGHLTAIGEAIGLSLKRLEQQQTQQKVLILLSDGRDTVETLPPLTAATLAAQAKMRIYTIGLGAEDPADPDGSNSDLDEQTLTRIAAVTGGQYFRARDPDSLAQIYRAIDELEPSEISARYYQPRQELYPWPLALALALSLLMLVRRLHE
ncbi:VWA domain-containing protein [Pseudaeromonas sp. ZJS20]|uniref:VWA domain-containing protein n=1 Tax=Pseudaeromonas aegiceratis TaxID=3153928 RepID=UPI00390C8FC8